MVRQPMETHTGLIVEIFPTYMVCTKVGEKTRQISLKQEVEIEQSNLCMSSTSTEEQLWFLTLEIADEKKKKRRKQCWPLNKENQLLYEH